MRARGGPSRCPFQAQQGSSGLKLKLGAEAGFDFFGGDHFDGVPGAAVEERAVGAFGGTLLAPDAELRINFDAAEGWVVLIGDPVHAVGDGAIGHAGGRARAARAALGDDGEFLGFLLARGFDAARFGLALRDFSDGNVKLRQGSSPPAWLNGIVTDGVRFRQLVGGRL